MPPANNIGFPATSDMVTSTIGVQTSCPSSPTHSNFYSEYDEEDDICPKHFTDIHRCKLEDTFSRKQKPDDIQLRIIAMECNLLYKDVRDWFRKRRLKWMDELVRNEHSLHNSLSSHSMKDNRHIKTNPSTSPTSDSNNNVSNNPVFSTIKPKQNNLHKHNTKEVYKSNKNILTNPGRSLYDNNTT